jgi:predicted nucleic acid-binding Zn ribbon protein
MARPVLEVPLADRIAVTAAEAGALIGRSDEFVRQQIAAGHLRPIPHCEQVLIATAELRRWAAEGLGGAA